LSVARNVSSPDWFVVKTSGVARPPHEAAALSTGGRPAAGELAAYAVGL